MLENPRWWHKIMLAYHAYQHGFLPEPGSMGEQHALFPEIMYWVETWLAHFGNIAAQTPEQRSKALEEEGEGHFT